MEIIDIIIAALLLFGFVKGIMKGFFIEVTSLIALLGGIYVAIHYGVITKGYLAKFIQWEDKYLTLIAFAVTFLAVAIVISIIGKLLTKLANFATLGLVNKVLGGAFGALKIGLLISVVLIVFDNINGTIPFVKKEQLEKSVLYQPVKTLVPTVFPKILNEFKAKQNEEKS